MDLARRHKPKALVKSAMNKVHTNIVTIFRSSIIDGKIAESISISQYLSSLVVKEGDRYTPDQAIRSTE